MEGINNTDTLLAVEMIVLEDGHLTRLTIFCRRGEGKD
jgi:hypothetical protein